MYEIVHAELVLRHALARGDLLTLPVLVIRSTLSLPTSALEGKA